MAAVQTTRKEAEAEPLHVEARTFGAFQLLVNGKAVLFERSRARELLAYLIDRQGRSVSRAAVFATLYEDRVYDRAMQKQLDVVIRSLVRTLRACGAEGILEMRGGCLRVRPERLDCDLYRYLAGDGGETGVRRGAYMKGYAWAEMKSADLAETDMAALDALPPKAFPARRTEIRTFGGFDLLVDGRNVSFPRSKAKELLAYLTDRRGTWVTRKEAFTVLWEGRYYDRRMQNYFNGIVRCMRRVLEAQGAEEVVETDRGVMRIRPDRTDCDYFRFLEGDPGAMRAFRGEYMSDYSWASATEAFLDAIYRSRFSGRPEEMEKNRFRPT